MEWLDVQGRLIGVTLARPLEPEARQKLAERARIWGGAAVTAA
ncbi:MAG: hypothetical protein ACYCW6_15595 [Candidatus Xenobia bacterium]